MNNLSWLIVLGCLIILFIIVIRLIILITNYKDNKLYRVIYGTALPGDLVDYELGIIEEYLKINQPKQSNFSYEIYSLMFENPQFLDGFYTLLNEYNYDFEVTIKVDEVISSIEFINLTDNN